MANFGSARLRMAMAMAAVLAWGACQSTATTGVSRADGSAGAGSGGTTAQGGRAGQGGQTAQGGQAAGDSRPDGNLGGADGADDAENNASPDAASDTGRDTARDTPPPADSGDASAPGVVIWEGNPTKGIGVFGTLNIEDGATITAVADPTYGTVWKFHKPIGSRRCESSHLPNGLHAKEGDVWFIGWRYKLALPQDATTNAIFQWKAYPADGLPSLQNFPVVLKTFAGELQLLYHNPNDVSEFPWLSKTVVNEWTTVVLKLKVSRDPNVGYIELWHNGVPQVLKGGVTRYPARTLDGGYTDPKWGIYGAADIEATNYVHGLKIATSYEAAAPQ